MPDDDAPPWRQGGLWTVQTGGMAWWNSPCLGASTGSILFSPGGREEGVATPFDATRLRVHPS